MQALGRSDDQRRLDVIHGIPGFVGIVDDLAFGDGDAAGLQQRTGEILVARDCFGNGAGAVGLRRPDAAAAHAIAELDHVAVGQHADRRDAPLLRRRSFDDAAGARSEQLVLGHLAQMLDISGNIERPVLDGCHDELAARFEAGARDVFVPGAHDDLVYAADRGLACLAEAPGHAGEVLQFERHVFKDVAGPGAFVEAAQEAAAFAVAAAVLDQ